MEFLLVFSLFVLILQRSATQPGCLDDFSEYKLFSKCSEGYCGRDPNLMCKEPLSYGCYCQDGYTRRDGSGAGPCVPVSDCPFISCLDDFTEYRFFSKCFEGYCERDPRLRCKEPLSFGCYCKDGYTRRDGSGVGPCVPASECPKCKGPNERYQCSNPCFQSRDPCKGGERPVACPLYCIYGCYCTSGFRRENGNNSAPCVPIRCPRDD